MPAGLTNLGIDIANNIVSHSILGKKGIGGLMYEVQSLILRDLIYSWYVEIMAPIWCYTTSHFFIWAMKDRTHGLI